MAEYQYGGKGTQTFQKLHGFKKIVAWQTASDLGFQVSRLVKHCERWELITGSELTTLIKQYSDASFFLDRLIQALIKKEQDGTWDKSYWTKEEQADYRIDIEAGTEFLEFPQVP